MKSFAILSVFTISLLTSAMGFCCDFNSPINDNQQQINKGYAKHPQGAQQLIRASFEADFLKAQQRNKPHSIAPKASIKKVTKPIPGSAAYALMKNK